jgi:hypothetical protein
MPGTHVYAAHRSLTIPLYAHIRNERSMACIGASMVGNSPICVTDVRLTRYTPITNGPKIMSAHDG